MKKTVTIFIAIFSLILIFGNASSTTKTPIKYTVQEYIDIYKALAVREMNRSGIPASITMAQAILESAYGNSELAVNANNHFGIKNKSDWKGAIYFKGGCYYKKYNSILESYEDHTNHLLTRQWYQSLFKLEITDYKNWGHGLKKAGYAEDPQYAYKLIKIIEKYNFTSLDSLHFSIDSTLANNKIKATSL